jgi:hypothetical protein
VEEDTAMTVTTTLVAIAIPALMLLGLIGMLWAAGRVEQRRNERYARQIQLTDAIHRELGAIAAPIVERRRGGRWLVTMVVPFDEPDTVASLLRITERMRQPSDGAPASYEVVLRPCETTPQPWTAIDDPVRVAA